jgi:hypothetical protein
MEVLEVSELTKPCVTCGLMKCPTCGNGVHESSITSIEVPVEGFPNQVGCYICAVEASKLEDGLLWPEKGVEYEAGRGPVTGLVYDWSKESWLWESENGWGRLDYA